MKREDLIELVKTGEGYTIEFKESLSSSLSKEICAFANASGGKIILGVRDDNSIKGCHLSNSDFSKIQDIKISNDCFRTIIKRDTVKDTPNEGLNEGLNGGLKLLFNIILKNTGIPAKKCSELLRKSIKTIERQIKTLIEKKLIERRGSNKTGGYWIVNNVERVLK